MNKSHIITTLFLSLLCFNSQAQQTPKPETDVPAPALQNDVTKSSTELMIYQQEISAIQVVTGDPAATIFLYGPGNWTVYNSDSGCPNPGFAMIKTDQPGAQELLSMALLAKTQKTPVTLHGVCGYHPNYFEIQKILL